MSIDPKNIYVVDTTKSATYFFNNSECKEIVRIAANGSIFWNGREIHTDDDFKAAMLQLRDVLIENMKGCK
jgi:hypothetical protein